MSNHGAQLRHQREQLGLSQAKLAELAQIPQHQLSAAELGKTKLTPALQARLAAALNDPARVAAVVGRRKRYQPHHYETPPHLPNRIAQAAPTPGNAEYVRALQDLDQRHQSPAPRTRTFVSLFAGGGGLTLGFSAAGFASRGFVEREPDLQTIYRANFPASVMLAEDVTAPTPEQLQTCAGQLGAIDVLIGGPPCQGFSLAGKRKVADPRNTLFRHYLRWVAAFRPQAALLENVRLLTSMRTPTGTWVQDDIREAFRALGYTACGFTINAWQYGVPQHRERVIFVALRQELQQAPTCPLATHGLTADLFGPQLSPPRSFGDACSDLAYLESGERSADPLHQAVQHPAHVLRWLWDVPQGASAHDNPTADLRPPSGYNTTYKRQVWHEPAATVQTTFGMISGCRNVHPIATRALTIREAARIQSFPDSYAFPGTCGAVRTAIGNAVPPLLAEAFARQLLQHLGSAS
jgi:DNA (cytosine-5)-methyltransferase 1